MKRNELWFLTFTNHTDKSVLAEFQKKVKHKNPFISRAQVYFDCETSGFKYEKLDLNLLLVSN